MAMCTISTSGGNFGTGGGFSAGQIGDLIYNINFWNLDPNVNPNSFGTWTVPCDSTSGNCTDNPEEGSTDADGPCTFCWTTDNPRSYSTTNQAQCENNGGSWSNGVCTLQPNDTFAVTAYPNILFGSQGGRNSTYGFPCNTLPVLQSTGRCGGSALYDLEWVNSQIGLPERVDKITTSSFCYDILKNCSGDNANVENVFIDTYLHRIDRSNLWPTTYQAAYGDLNKVNGDNTETWNINFKLCLPEFAGNSAGTGITNDPGAQSTGGVRINTTPITIDGKQWAVYFKWEALGASNPRDQTTGAQQNGDCTNSFFYISFIPWDVGTGVTPTACDTNFCCNFKLFLDWVGSQEFKNRILGTGGFAPVAANKQNSGQQANWPLWVYNNVGRPPFVVDEPESYVLAGFQIGNELWFSPTNQSSCICYENVQFETDLGTFGKAARVVTEPGCFKASCTAVVSDDTDCDCSGVPTSANGVCGQPLSIGFGLPAAASVTGATTSIAGTSVTGLSASGLTLNSSGCTSAVSGTVQVNYTLSGINCQCDIQVTLNPETTTGGCVGGVSNPALNCPQTLKVGVTSTLTVTGCCPGATIQWTADSPNVSFGSPNSATTTVTTTVTGNYAITASCCD